MPGAYKIHQSHPEIVKRLKRVQGHLRSVVDMIEDGRPCLEIAQQLHAVEKAVGQAKKTLVHDHIDHSLDHAVGTNHRKGRGSVEEFKAISKYL
jgi:DNA-binding FrmR family transcriptional regulator